ncbi:hypothetical protein TD95_000427 [Thielaviopsis punctulata]|uniref:Uncharacterized protein n=1 Tax=Thielaviopsis punctulata TaxID=72032 RepID=A0A0F4ZHZ1_9PEZI|nr:hypothetical protein TD95_000427 [Thielaviopsis punctulata]
MRSSLAQSSLLGSFFALATAMQPDAVKPVESPMRDLTWGQLNFLHTTDTHGWFGGHVSEHQYSADWGDYVSFAHHMRRKADDLGADLLLIDTGDRVEGNGLYDASSPKGLYTYDIYRQQDVDILSVGNHELYQRETADREQTIQVPNFKDNYVSSNLDYVDPETGEQRPFAQRYKRFKTKNRGIDVLAFGFIFDFTGNQNNTVVQRTEDTIKEKWFQDAIRLKPDIFVVFGHVGLRMPELKAVYTAIRKQNWHTPIAIFAGHAHVRDALSYDSKAFAMASGRYFETVGWMSIDGLQKSTTGEGIEAASSVSFTRRYLDNNLFGYYYHTGLNESTFPTEKGLATSKMVYEARTALKLNEKYGCAPRSLWMSRVPYPHKNSIYSWFANESLSGIFYNAKRADKPRMGFLNTGGVRFDIFRGLFTSDSLYNVSPFTSRIVYLSDVPYEIASKILAILNNSGPIFNAASVRDCKHMAPPEVWAGKNLQRSRPNEASARMHAAGDQIPMGHAQPEPSPELTAGYTTQDDIGTDGDDTVHSPIEYFNAPNCIQATTGFSEDVPPEAVDVVFIDFLTPWVLAATKFAGGDYTDKDVKMYSEGTFSENLGEWIKKNWQGDC